MLEKTSIEALLKTFVLMMKPLKFQLFLSISNNLLVCNRKDMGEVTKQQIIITLFFTYYKYG